MVGRARVVLAVFVVVGGGGGGGGLSVFFVFLNFINNF